MIYFVQIHLSSDILDTNGRYKPAYVKRIIDVCADNKLEAKKMAVKEIREEFSGGECSATILAEVENYVDDEPKYMF